MCAGPWHWAPAVRIPRPLSVNSSGAQAHELGEEMSQPGPCETVSQSLWKPIPDSNSQQPGQNPMFPKVFKIEGPIRPWCFCLFVCFLVCVCMQPSSVFLWTFTKRLLLRGPWILSHQDEGSQLYTCKADYIYFRQ